MNMLISDEEILARLQLLIEIGNNSFGSNYNNELVKAADYLETHGFIINHENYVTLVKFHRCELTEKGKALLESIKQIIL